jgi:hypothetical protein
MDEMPGVSNVIPRVVEMMILWGLERNPSIFTMVTSCPASVVLDT